METQFSFKHGYPPGMRLSKNFKAQVKEWQRLPYGGPNVVASEKKSKAKMMAMEKQAMSIIHEFLSLTVEKMVKVDLNVRDLFLDHLGIFYLPIKGKWYTIFLKETYE
ncbi:ROOT PRIMORDIUM DEFECTIVE 1 protein [Spatholobus suberectus]|nr:ROOT PRIMORDIUM DEFECTIVE 1 protein [Spatholobus suberectus]